MEQCDHGDHTHGIGPNDLPCRKGTPANADIYHVYIDLEQGTWGDRKSLAILSLTETRVNDLRAMTPAEIKALDLNRYFGNVADATAVRRHLGDIDLPAR